MGNTESDLNQTVRVVRKINKHKENTHVDTPSQTNS